MFHTFINIFKTVREQYLAAYGVKSMKYAAVHLDIPGLLSYLCFSSCEYDHKKAKHTQSVLQTVYS